MHRNYAVASVAASRVEMLVHVVLRPPCHLHDLCFIPLSCAAYHGIAFLEV